MKPINQRKTVYVGVFIIIGLAFLLGGILTVGNLRNTFTTKLHLVVMFEDVNGLQKGNNIWFSGVKIGTVGSVKFFGQKHVKVVLSVDESSQPFIRKDATAKISSDGFIGNKILVINGGSYKAEMVTEGDTIAAERVAGTEQMLKTLDSNSRNLLDITNDIRIISHRLSIGQGNAGKLLTDSTLYDNLKNSSASMRRIMAQTESFAGTLKRFGDGLEKPGTIGHGLTHDTTMFRNLSGTAARLRTATDSANALVIQLKSATANKNTPLGVLMLDEPSGDRVKNILKNLESGSAKLDQDLEAMQHNFLLRRYFKKKSK